jgi:signal transduction histidine kinase
MKLSGILKKIPEILKSSPSFRAQMVSFIAVMLALTMLAISLINQRLEERTTNVVEEYLQEIPVAINLVLRSLYEDRDLYDMVSINSESIIRHIFIVDEGGKIFRSTDRNEIGNTYNHADDAQSINAADLKANLHKTAGKETTLIQFPMTTVIGDDQNEVKRDVHIVLSLKRLEQVKESSERYRFIAFVLLGLLLIVAIWIFTKSITSPIIELGRVAEKVTEGNLDCGATVSGPKEIRMLSQTFNEMLSRLRSKRNLEELLQRAERSAVVGRLASGIAHEIRNPLNFINLSIDHLRAAFAPKEEGPRAQYIHMLTTIKDELARLNRLVSDFLGYGRPAKLKIREIDARSLIEEVRDLVHTHAEQHAVTVNIKQDAGSEAKLQGDAELIKTCFSNLMINAIQAMPGGGALDISLRPDNGFLEIKFADTGVGIMPEDLAQIFEPYYSTKETGIGLGLPLTKKIIEEHGGKIDVESGPGRGTTFTVTLLREP